MAHARPALAKAYNQAVTEATDQGATSSGEAGPSAAPPPLSQALLHSRPSELDLLESSGGRPESPVASGKEVVSPIKRRNSKRLSLGESRTDEDIAAEVAALEAALLQKDFATLEEAFYKGMRKQAGALLLSNIFEHLGLGVSQEAITEIERHAGEKCRPARLEEGAPSASPDRLKGSGRSYAPQQPPEQLGSLPWPQQPASACSHHDAFPRSASRSGEPTPIATAPSASRSGSSFTTSSSSTTSPTSITTFTSITTSTITCLPQPPRQAGVVRLAGRLRGAAARLEEAARLIHLALTRTLRARAF